MARMYSVPDWWNDRYHALFDQFVGHMEREFAGVPTLTNRQAFHVEPFLEWADVERDDPWWDEPFYPVELDYKDDRHVNVYHLYYTTAKGFQSEMPAIMCAVLDPDYTLVPDEAILTDRFSRAETEDVDQLTYGQKRVVRQYLEMAKLQVDKSAEEAIEYFWHQFPPFFETIA